MICVFDDVMLYYCYVMCYVICYVTLHCNVFILFLQLVRIHLEKRFRIYYVRIRVPAINSTKTTSTTRRVRRDE